MIMNRPYEIFEEYRRAADFKASLGKRGLYEQKKINERFYIGDQWYGAKCGNDRPLVRHNIIKRICDYKMSQILSAPLSVSFSAEGIPTVTENADTNTAEIGKTVEALGNYHSVTAERVGLTSLYAQALRDAYISGTGIIYTYWNGDIKTGLFADKQGSVSIKGDIACEVLDIENVYFADPYTEDIQRQPYIIIASCRAVDEVLREAEKNGAEASALKNIEYEATDGKITVFTKLYREYGKNGDCKIKCVKVTETATVKREFDTGLTLYPLAVFAWEKRGGMIYGESEITYLIPNQIAINRMITANVWSVMTAGMPMMIINGDTVPDGITNEPGQIIKVFGSREEVDGAVKYVTPPDFSRNFEQSLQGLIENTLTQSGANEVALGDSRADNATALRTMQNAAVMPLKLIKSRFYSFAEELARIWADFWISCYGRRGIKLNENGKIKYFPFDSERLRGLIINAKIDVGTGAVYSDGERMNTLLTLFEKGIINRRQFLTRLPDGIIPDKRGLLAEESEDGKE